VDGVVLIDQSHALAGNINPGDGPGFPITISQPGSYRLSGNLTVTDINTTAIQITADHVTIDLNGFGIYGPVVCTGFPASCPAPGKGIGIDAENGGFPGPLGIKILNGTVAGMGSNGIFVNGDASYVEKVTATNNAGGGLLVNGVVVESGANRNGSFGIFAITVRDSIATGNHTVGIRLDASGGVGIGNIASFNGAQGIDSPNGTVINNTAVRNGTFGITALCPSSIFANTVVSNTQGTIQTTDDGGTGCILSNNATR
jgi:hypothetical protein